MTDDTRAAARAQAHADRLHQEILANPDQLPSGAARFAALVLSLLVIVSTIALVPFGLWLLVALPNRVMGVIAAALVLGVVWSIRPRRPKLPDDAAAVAAAPQLEALLAQVAAAAGTTPPTTVALTADINASVYDGPRRQGRVLLLGAPMWLALGPQARVALLAHELGHFASGDTRRYGIVGGAFEVLQGWRALLDDGSGADPDANAYGQYAGTDGSTGGAGLIAMISAFLTRVLLWVVGLIPLSLGWVLSHLTSRDSQRSEYQADRIMVRVAGRDGALALLQLLQREAALDAALQRAALARTDTLAAAAAFDAATEAPMTAPGRHDRADPFDSHPPTPYRIEAVAAQPAHTPAVVLDSTRSDAVDAELANALGTIERRVRDRYFG